MTPFLLFDFDGTIADSIHLGLSIANELAEEFGLSKIDDAQFQILRSMSIPKALRELKIPLYKVPKLIPRVLAEYRHQIQTLKPFTGIIDMLKELKLLDIPMALLSSNSRENVVNFLSHWDMDCFNWVEGTSGILHKHHSIRHQMKKHGILRQQAIYIGDEQRDIIAAKKCGIRIISVSWGFHTKDLLVKSDPDFLVDSPKEVIGIVKTML